MNVKPPCRIYFYCKRPEGEQYAVFDVDFGDNLAGFKFRLKLVDKKIDVGEVTLCEHIERIADNPLYSELSVIQNQVTSIAKEVESLGWKVRILPLENPNIKF
ncbi:MAG: hypothetical protein GC178_13530 [Flavobacteriales bacterium]|nr:hypothetical protein [Flavobacteriales bacterium]